MVLYTDTFLCSKVGSEAMLIQYEFINPQVIVLIKALQAETVPGIRLVSSQEELLAFLL